MGPSQLPSARYRHVVFPDTVPGREPERRAPGTPPEQAGSSTQLTPDERSFLTWLFHAAGLDVGRYKAETLKRRLPACLRVAHCADVHRAGRVLRQNAGLRVAAVSALVIGVTNFFRDEPVFAAIADQVLPALGERDEIRVCSVGCSDGAELYSVAMLLAERGLLGRSRLLGADCRPDAVAHARAGVFDDRAMQCVPADLARRYFTGGSSARRVDPVLARACEWVVTDAVADAGSAADWISGEWDLVLCRNLAIYLQPAAAGQLFRRLELAVRPGGVLCLGKAERPARASSLRPIGPCLFRRVGGTTPAGEQRPTGGVSEGGRTPDLT